MTIVKDEANGSSNHMNLCKAFVRTLAVPAIAGLLMSPVAIAAGTPMSAILSGENEVGPGDPDGAGVMAMTLNSGQEEICWELVVEDIDAPTRAHIHRGEAGTNGPFVVFFFDTVISEPIPIPEDLSGCVDVPRDLVKEIRKNPAAFYVNVHNEAFPAGAVRGQLERRQGR
jgi:hypothetical protein